MTSTPPKGKYSVLSNQMAGVNFESRKLRSVQLSSGQYPGHEPLYMF